MELLGEGNEETVYVADSLDDKVGGGGGGGGTHAENVTDGI